MHLLCLAVSLAHVFAIVTPSIGRAPVLLPKQILSASIDASVNTSITVTYRNDGVADVLFYRPESALSPLVAWQSLTLKRADGSNVTTSTSIATSVVFGPPSENDFTRIAANTSVSQELDLSELYDLDSSRKLYQISLKPYVLGGTVDGSFNATQLLQKQLDFDAPTLNITLGHSLKIRDDPSGAEENTARPDTRLAGSRGDYLRIRIAIRAVMSLAQTALDHPDDETFQLYFGQNADKARVDKVLQALVHYDDKRILYNVTGNIAIDRDGTSRDCRGADALTFIRRPLSTAQKNVTMFFCENFMKTYDLSSWTIDSNCSDPAATTDNDLSTYSWKYTDPTYVMGHEMIHVIGWNSVSPTDALKDVEDFSPSSPLIFDVPKGYTSRDFAGDDTNQCYSATCIKRLAAEPWGAVTAVQNAESYIYYMQALSTPKARDCVDNVQDFSLLPFPQQILMASPTNVLTYLDVCNVELRWALSMDRLKA